MRLDILVLLGCGVASRFNWCLTFRKKYYSFHLKWPKCSLISSWTFKPLIITVVCHETSTTKYSMTWRFISEIDSD